MKSIADTTYKIVRLYFDENHPNHRDVINTGLTLDEAQAHCQDEATHEIEPTTGLVVWFDAYYAE